MIETKNQLVIDDKYLTLLGYPAEGVGNVVGVSSTDRDSVADKVMSSVRLNSGAAISSAPTSANDERGYAKSDSGATPAVTQSAGAAAAAQWAASAAGNAEKLSNFSLVSYVLANQLAAAVQLVKNLNAAVPSEHLLLYDLGLSAEDQRTMQKYCYSIMNASSLNALVAGTSSSSSSSSAVPLAAQHQQPPVRVMNLYHEATGSSSSSGSYNAYSVIQNSNNINNIINSSQVAGASIASAPPPPFKCLLIKFDVVSYGFPSYVIEDAQMHAFRPLIVRDALRHWGRLVLFLDNSVRLRPSSGSDLAELRRQVEGSASGVKGWRTEPKMAVSSRTHLKMYEYFHTDDDNFKFLKMISLDAMFFADRPAVHQRILLPWIKCALVPECIHPIGEWKLCVGFFVFGCDMSNEKG